MPGVSWWIWILTTLLKMSGDAMNTTFPSPTVITSHTSNNTIISSKMNETSSGRLPGVTTGGFCFPRIVAPSNGFLLFPCNNTVASTCSFACLPGFTLVGSPRTTCNASTRTWTSPAPFCTTGRQGIGIDPFSGGMINPLSGYGSGLFGNSWGTSLSQTFPGGGGSYTNFPTSGAYTNQGFGGGGQNIPSSAGGFNNQASGGFNNQASGGFNKQASGGFNNQASGAYNNPYNNQPIGGNQNMIGGNYDPVGGGQMINPPAGGANNFPVGQNFNPAAGSTSFPVAGGFNPNTVPNVGNQNMIPASGSYVPVEGGYNQYSTPGGGYNNGFQGSLGSGPGYSPDSSYFPYTAMRPPYNTNNALSNSNPPTNYPFTGTDYPSAATNNPFNGQGGSQNTGSYGSNSSASGGRPIIGTSFPQPTSDLGPQTGVFLQPGLVQPGLVQPGLVQSGLVQPGLVQPGLGGNYQQPQPGGGFVIRPQPGAGIIPGVLQQPNLQPQGFCPSLTPPTNGVQAGQCTRARPGASCFFSCMSGFVLSGFPVLTCGVTGQWTPTGDPPTCVSQITSSTTTAIARPTTCSALQSPTNGVARGNCVNATNGQICNFSCFLGSILSGNPVLICNNGTWSSAAPVCRGRVGFLQRPNRFCSFGLKCRRCCRVPVSVTGPQVTLLP